MANIYVRGLWPALALSVVSSAVNAQEASGFGGDFALSIRDCTGVAAEDSCVFPGVPADGNPPILRDFQFGIAGSTAGSIQLEAFGSAEGSVDFGGGLFTPTLRNAVASSAVARNGASIFARQTLTYTGTRPVSVPLGGFFTYSMTGTADPTCRLSKEIPALPNPQHLYIKDECSTLNIALRVTDLQTNQVLASEFYQSSDAPIASPLLVGAEVEMIPGRAYEIYAQVQTIARGAGQSIDSLNSFTIGLVDPETGEVTRDVPDSLPELQETLIPASDENQPSGIGIDVLPGSMENAIKVDRLGVVPVALITTPDFYAPDVDRDSLRFGPASALVALPGGGVEDVDGDGDMDYVIHFQVSETGISCSDELVYLSGSTLSGDIVFGSDTVRPIGCK